MIPKTQMSDEERVRDLQRKLYLKAKREKEFRFYVLYDKIRLGHFLREAYRRCSANKGAPGVDGVRFEDIEREGEVKLLEEIRQELESRTYKPSAVLRKYIPKGNGKMRPLGIPTIKDRVIQMAVKMVIEPIFEADFEDCSYGFRPKRSTRGAVKEIKQKLQEGNTAVYDADLRACFDTIPHRELLRLIGRRISDKNIIHVIKMWLKAPIMEDERPKGGKKNKVGTPQGGVISPLLANIYLNVIDKAVNRQDGIFKKGGIKIVRYADDFVLMGRQLQSQSIEYFKSLLERMKLTLNKEKSRVLNAREKPFDFLGFTFRNDKDIYGRKMKYWNIIPSEKSMKKVRTKIKEYLGENGHKSPENISRGLNMITRGWLNYFTIGNVSYPQKAKRKLRYYLMEKLQRYYRRKSQRKSKLYNRGAFQVLVDSYGLIDPYKSLSTMAAVNV